MNGSDLDSEWDEALRVFWREREVVREMRRNKKHVSETTGVGPLDWFKWQDCSWKDAYQEEDEDEDEEGEEFWKGRIGKDDAADQDDSADGPRRDSGGGEGKDADAGDGKELERPGVTS